MRLMMWRSPVLYSPSHQLPDYLILHFTSYIYFMVRTRRLRSSPILRELVAETRLSRDMFIYPYFVTKGKNKVEAIEAMPGISRFSSDKLAADVEKGLKSGVNKILLFGVGDDKHDDAHSSHDEHSVVAD